MVSLSRRWADRSRASLSGGQQQARGGGRARSTAVVCLRSTNRSAPSPFKCASRLQLELEPHSRRESASPFVYVKHDQEEADDDVRTGSQ